MLSIKDHPFAVEAFFKSSLVLTFALPKEELQGLIPECLQLDTLDEKWAFLAVALVKAKDLRPKGFPKFMGNDFFLAGFRIFVRYTNNKGKSLRGLYILRSEADKKKMSLLGNIFTRYAYHTTDIDFSETNEKIKIISKKSELDIEVYKGDEPISLPKDSPFKDWKEARHFAGPLPFTFTYNKKTREVLIIEGARENWVPKPVEVIKYNVGFVNRFKEPVFANAFLIQDIPYYWKKGKTEIWKG
jgi:uncharacterized protein YqjF (DUF2071 family)